VSDITDHRALHEAILTAPGTAYLNRSSARSFSLNIFQINAQELIEATLSVRDVDEGLRLMSVENREAGQQAHREINRLVHNFVAASKTLVDHTREFIQEYYAGTILEDEYKARVRTDFASDPVSKFVQDLRNYMLHKALPRSHMFIHFDNTSNDPDGPQLETGVRYLTRALSEWDGWTAPAKVYIEAAGEHIDIHIFAEKYLEKVLRFHAWLDSALEKLHAADLVQLKELHEAFSRNASAPPTSKRTLEPPERPENSCTPGESPLGVVPFKFSPTVAAEIDEAGEATLKKIRSIKLAHSRDGACPSERPIGATLTSDEIIETPIVWGNDSDGRPVIAFLASGAETFGLDANAYMELQQLAEKVLAADWAKEALSRNFIEETAVHWLRSSFRVTPHATLSDAISGSVKIAPITRIMIDELEAKGIESSPRQRDDIATLFKDLRSRMQGLAAVVVRVEAEPIRGYEHGYAIAQDVVGLLRFFSPVASDSRRVCSTALLGMEPIPHSQTLVLGEGHFSFRDAAAFAPFVWRLSKQHLQALWGSGLSETSCLVSPFNLNEFSLAVRASLLLYSTGMTLHQPADRLVYILSSVEGILLRHFKETPEFKLEERMSLLASSDKGEREKVARNAREAYRFRRRHGASVLTPYDASSLGMFVHNTYRVLRVALENVGKFATKADFIDAVDRIKTAAPV
jgi:hypothetical protein